MVRTKGTTSPKAFQLQFKLKQSDQATINNNNNNGDGESSFRLLYYASAGSVPFMWESHPGTPKHSTTQSSLFPTLTPPPAFHPTTSLRTLFLDASFRKPRVEAAAPPPSSTSYSSASYDSSPQSRTSLRSLFLASSSRKGHVAASPVYSSLPSTPMEFRRRRAGVMEEKHVDVGGGGGDGSPTSTLCFGGGLMMVCRIKKKVKNALMSIGGHGKSDNVI
ncbi:hypothetical protein L6452_05345 [Arctium lappa]|uniref:Uncharacterized protein n=1 Tax=Arctium lappa TaxID=4217 RepID=A0ACB9EG57_ARCLA|nr:hypothetical protein L6452_05345 [Arctium lappa]